MRTNQVCHRSMQQRFRVIKNSCSELIISSPTMTTREGGDSQHRPVMWWGGGEGKDQDGQHRHIISPGWCHTSQQAILTTNRVYKIYCDDDINDELMIYDDINEFNTIILWLGKTKKPNLSSFPDVFVWVVELFLNETLGIIWFLIFKVHCFWFLFKNVCQQLSKKKF